MTYGPIALTLPQYENYPNNWLKAYLQGTTTPLSMATDSTASTLLAKCELDAQGFPITAGSARFIPFLDQQYDLWLFPTSTEADANDTTNAIQMADNLSTVSGITTFANKTEALAAALVNGRQVFITSVDGGAFIMRTGAAATTYDDDGGAFTGTKFTGGDGSTGFERNLMQGEHRDGYWFGCTDGGLNDTAVGLLIASIIDGVGTTVYIPNSKFAAVVVFDKSRVTIDCAMNEMSFDSTYVKGGLVGVPWDETFFNTLWVCDAEKINIVNTAFDQGAFNRTAIFLWHAVAANYCVVDRCLFTGIIYQTIDVNGVAIQTSPSTFGIKITNNNFYDCAAAVSLKGFNGVIDNCTHYITAAQVTGVPGSTDQAFGLDGSDGSICTNTTVIRGAGAPQAGADIGANASTNYIIANCYISGFTGGRAFFMQGSSKGLIDGNICDGGGFVSVAAWTMFNIEDVSGDNVISNNICRNPPITTSFGRAIEVSAANNIVRDNRIEMGTVDKTFAGIAIINGDTSGYLTIENNHIECANTGIYFDGITDNDDNPIRLSNNTYAGVMTTAWGNSGALIRNIPVYIENENFTGASISTFSIPKYSRFFNTQKTGQFDHRITDRTVIHGAEVPVSGATWDFTTWHRGDIITNSLPSAKDPLFWRCVYSGTFDSGATVSEAGTTTNTSPTITAMADTSDIFVGDVMVATAGFATLTEIKVIAKTSSTITMDQDANATGATTVTLSQPIWEGEGESGTWTPSLGGTTTYNTQTGEWRRIGGLIYIKCIVHVSTIGTGSSNVITGLPFPVVNTSKMDVVVGTSAVNFVSVSARPNSSQLNIEGQTAASASNQGVLAVFGSGAYVEVNGWYEP